jgi:hypothetical protein
MHKEELNNFYQILAGRMRCMGHVACMGEIRNAYKILDRKPEVNKLLRSLRHLWEVNIKMDLIDIW